jgi:predicted nucleic acid-binding Zn ribbon protein
MRIICGSAIHFEEVLSSEKGVAREEKREDGLLLLRE